MLFFAGGRRCPAQYADATPRLVLIIQAAPAKPGDDAYSSRPAHYLPVAWFNCRGAQRLAIDVLITKVRGLVASGYDAGPIIGKRTLS